ncbi:nucleotidyltransferase family protein [Parvularcula sp. LCG005]|uniref:nucleotidyltransferase family protein n=1 Tax=Parvularcula sp. LCG005 TaxID=3078805 RepID=UPI0029433669|nr:nucleotidyltransferase family protein [Parvularcula sp. LCG005]WOI53498.1 nucleotidyltransferase family protein [Parvularcula sp. LCG005]
MTTCRLDTAMVLAAGLGTRFREVSGDLPKPLVKVGGKALIDWTLDLLAKGDVERAVVNVHYKADAVEAHLADRHDPEITISDERDQLMETGGGLIRATPLLGDGPVFCTNTDAIIEAGSHDPVGALRSVWEDREMDALLLLVPLEQTSGYQGNGDFVVDHSGRLAWDGEGPRYVFSGLQIIHPRLWADEKAEPKSTRVFWEKAMASGRLFGLVHDLRWMHVGDRAGFEAAERHLHPDAP